MNDKTVDRCRRLAKEFSKRAEHYQTLDNLARISGSKEGGALRRASMELTRALADLRQGR
jgi:hypothetical protein